MKNLKLEKIIVVLNLILGLLQLGDIMNKFAKERKMKKQETVSIAHDQVWERRGYSNRCVGCGVSDTEKLEKTTWTIT